MKSEKKKKKSRLEFQDYSYEDAEKDEAQMQRGNYGKLKTGKNVLRIMPARKGEDWKLVFYKHFVTVDGQKKSFICPLQQTKGKRKCKTCTKEKKLRDSGDKNDLLKANDISAQKKIKINAINREDEEAGPKEYELSPGINRSLIDFRKIDGVNFMHPTEGADITIMKIVKGTGRNGTSYKTSLARDTTPLHEDENVMREWIENQPELKVQIDGDEDIEAILNGEDPRDARRNRRDKDDDDDKPRKRKASRDEDEDEDELDDDDLDDQDDDDEDEDDEEISF